MTYEKEIVNHASQIVDEAKRIWSKSNIRDNVYTVVREFNMTKGNVFPNEMLSDPKKAICMFVKKREIIKTEIQKKNPKLVEPLALTKKDMISDNRVNCIKADVMNFKLMVERTIK